MKQLYFSIFISTILILTSCKREEIKKGYYVISKQDSINKAYVYDEKSKTPPPPPPAPQWFKWYADIVFIMDSKNKVYVYQTENIFKYNYKNDKAKKLIFDYEYPNYIGLKPEYLITFDSNNFISFLKTNNDIFELISNVDDSKRKFFYIVSDSDTIKNPALYELEKVLKNERRVFYLIRKTTEEENYVLKYKRNKHIYIPESINWSDNFIDGKSKPFTEKYNNIDSKIESKRKAKETYKKGSLKVLPIL
jgi:hypothetical protein